MKNLAIILIVAILFLSGCSNETDNISGGVVKDDQSSLSINVDKVEVYHFHGTHQCYSCITVGKYAKETINMYFKNELKSGKVVFGDINVDLPENREVVMKYGATGSSLWLGVYDKEGFHAEQNVNVWYKIRDKQQYMNYLKDVIQKRLSGDFS